MPVCLIARELEPIDFPDVDLDALIARSSAEGTIEKHGDQIEHVSSTEEQELIESIEVNF